MHLDRRRLLRAALSAFGLLVAVSAAAQSLPASLQRSLQLLQPAQRALIEAHVHDWARWTPTARAAFDARLAQWDALPMHERTQRRETWAAWQQLGDEERARLRAVAAQLDPATRAGLHAQFDALDASTRRGWMLGPALGADYAALQPLLVQLPAQDHEPVLRTLRAMSAIERGKLAVLVSRTPPQQREQLRRDLVSTSQVNRAAWLDLRLQR